MLEYLDTLIGLAAIMLGLSLIVTIANQMLSSVSGLRGLNLRWGLATLVHTLHKSPEEMPLSKFGKPTLALLSSVDEILLHPLVSDSAFPLCKLWRRATAIRFDEFMKMIGLLGKESEPLLKWLSENNKLTNPWFDSMMDRGSQHFAMMMKVLAGGFALVLALSLHIDTLDIVQALRSDQQLRLNFVAAADAVNKLGQTLPAGDKEHEQLLTTARSLLAPLGQQAQAQTLGTILHQPRPNEHWYFYVDDGLDWRHLAGVVLTAGLLSLGAPFWFNTLKGLSALRSVVAKKEQDERETAKTAPDTGDGIQWIDLPR